MAFIYRHIQRKMIRVAGMICLGCLAVLFSMQGIVEAIAAPVVTLGKTATGEGQDFATLELAQPWDMSAAIPYPDYPSVFLNFNRASFSAQNGIWSVSTTSNDPNVMIFQPNMKDTQQALKQGGSRYAIDASKYKLLSMRLCIPNTGYHDNGYIYWFTDLIGPTLAIGLSNPFPLVAGCHVYTIDMSKIGTRSGAAWSGMLKGLRLKLGAPGNLNLGTVNFQFDWIRLTNANTGTQQQVPINWSNITSGTNLNFYLNTGCSLSNATLIGRVARGTSTSGTFNWGSSLSDDPTVDTNPYGYQQLALPLPESFQPGQYTVVLQSDNGTPICAGSPLEIRRAPILGFQKPGMTSGPDYALAVTGNPWDMSDPGDVTQTYDISGVNFSNGILNAVAGATDPALYLRVPVGLPIDTAKFHYMTFRALYDGSAPDNSFVSIMRFLWWYRGPGIDSVTAQDLPLHEGWQTYSFDMRTALIEPSSLGTNPGWNGQPTVLRFKPTEGPSVPFHLDYVTLSGDESVRAGTRFPLIYQLSAAGNASIAFYYDTDRNPANGRTAISANQQIAAGSYKVYLPLALASAPGSTGGVVPGSGQTWNWDTMNVPSGTYYIAADVSDGVNTATWYSEVPVTVYR